MAVNQNLMLLPGGSRYNRYWAEDMKKQLDQRFVEVEFHRYRHWNNSDDKDLDIYHEAYQLDDIRNRLKEFGVVAYAEGVMLALYAIKKGVIRPKFCVFLSFPWNWTKGRGLNDDLMQCFTAYQLPTLYIQAQFDPSMPYLNLEQYVRSYTKNFTLLMQPAEADPYYDDIYNLAAAIEKYAGQFK